MNTVDKKIAIEEISTKLSFLNLSKLDGRAVSLLPYFNQHEWEIWLPNDNGELIQLKGGEPVESEYFAKEPVKEGDVFFEFFNFILKRANYADINSYVRRVLLRRTLPKIVRA